METKSSSHINVGSKEEEPVKNDRISGLPDDVLLGIVQLLDLHTAVRVGTLARRWRRLPRFLPDLVIDVADLIPHHWDFSPHTADHVMRTYADATRWLLAPTEQRIIRSLRLAFYLIDPYLQSIGHAIAEGGCNAAERLEFVIRTEVDDGTVSDEQRLVFTQCFMSFIGACPVAFSWLTSLTLQNLCFGGSDIPNLLNACNRLKLLSLCRCHSSADSVLEIDAPSSSLLALEIRACYYRRVELIRLPRLERVVCDVKCWWGESFPVRFGYLPCLHGITFASFRLVMLSEWLSSPKNISTMHLHFTRYENPRELSPIFNNLRDIYLYDLNTWDLIWTLSVLEAAPFLRNLSIQLPQIWWPRRPLKIANLPRETRMFEHCKLSLLEIRGCGLAADDEVLRYIRLIRERALCLKILRLLEICLSTECHGRGVTCTCQINEPQKNRLRKDITDGFSSSIQIMIELMTLV